MRGQPIDDSQKPQLCPRKFPLLNLPMNDEKVSSRKLFKSRAVRGHSATHIPHSTHLALETLMFDLDASAFSVMAEWGHNLIHVRHLMHWSVTDIFPSDSDALARFIHAAASTAEPSGRHHRLKQIHATFGWPYTIDASVK